MWRFVVEEAGRSKLQALPRRMRRLPSSFLFWRQQSSRVGWNVVDRRCRRGTVLAGRMVLWHDVHQYTRACLGAVRTRQTAGWLWHVYCDRLHAGWLHGDRVTFCLLCSPCGRTSGYRVRVVGASCLNIRKLSNTIFHILPVQPYELPSVNRHNKRIWTSEYVQKSVVASRTSSWRERGITFSNAHHNPHTAC